MKKGLTAVFALLGLAFLVVTYLKHDKKDSEQKNRPAKTENTNRAEVLDFWETYHQATDLRTAGKIEQAATYYNKALEFNSEHKNSLYYYGNMNLLLGHYQQAEEAWKKLVSVNPSSARAHSQLGHLYSCPDEQNPYLDLEEATRQFEKALSLNREETGPLLQLAKINLVQNNFKKAYQQLEDVIASNFRSVEAIFLKGYLEWKRKEIEHARMALVEARSILTGTSDKKNIGEGDTGEEESDAERVNAPSRCDLYKGLFPTLIHETDEKGEAVSRTYRRLDSVLSRFSTDE